MKLPNKALALVVLAALVARGALLAPALRSGRLADPDDYLILAHSLARGQGLALNGRPTAYRPPLYPLILAPIAAAPGEAWEIRGVAMLHLVLGAATVLLTALAARRWGLAPGRVILAAAIVALDPVLVAQGRSAMTETLAAFLTAATLAALARPGKPWAAAALGGLAFGLGALCRPSLLPPAGLAALALAWSGPGPWRDRLALAALLLAATAAVLAPWALRNRHVLGRPVFTTTHGGYTLYLANNPVYYDEVVDAPGDRVWSGPNQRLWWDSIDRGTRGMTEVEADRWMQAQALRTIAARPRDFLRASVARLGRFWGLAPSGSVYPRRLRLLTAAWTLPLWMALALGLMSSRVWSWPRIAAPAMILALTALHAVYWTDLRMRAPVVPAIALIAASARTREHRSPARKKFKIPEDSAVQIPEKR